MLAFLKRTNSESGMRVLLGFTVIHFLVRIIQLNPMLLSNPSDFNKTKDEDIKLKTFFQSLLKLYSAKSMLADIYIRSRLRRISYEMIFSIIPVLVFIVIVGNITSPTQEYNHAVLRITYSIALAIIFVPILLLAMRTVMIFFLLKTNALTISSLLYHR
jgi:hypothetical protein